MCDGGVSIITSLQYLVYLCTPTTTTTTTTTTTIQRIYIQPCSVPPSVVLPASSSSVICSPCQSVPTAIGSMISKWPRESET
ncbi:hypothetical protein BO70DRAFT_143173 [Aspergillus heteromorphus CBS 117.55]|uniref:Uncharacterized protein n=1 Tax=Aspergillus heteromorphus CBS 117.55 TaxID=1448321 RepID=A0A317VA69_9EURO|nr:uncharacterized protein BO70DRAFT_143173 [Aspergillus heteromorphus CBS 117.55]PWY70239.1 hypothetical protein BO70DRAFT_143173 [Aspergillus heteromorphus CBS 117.55]